MVVMEKHRRKKCDTQIQTHKHTCHPLRFLCCCNVVGVPSTHSKEKQKNCNTSMLLLVVNRRIPHNSLILTCFCQHQLLLFVMVTHSHSISMHTPNAYSSLQITHPWAFIFALGLLTLHHRYEQHIFKET